MDCDDANLMRRWQAGDAAAFEALVRRWEQPVARFLTRLAERPDRVADLCQEVFMRLYLAGPRYRETGAFSTWLYQIALNAARDAGRRRRHEPASLAEQDEPAAPALAEAICERRELAEQVTQLVAELPPPLREVLVLRHYEGLTFEEIGRVLATPPSTLKSRFALALARLRVRLRQRGWSPEETP